MKIKEIGGTVFAIHKSTIYRYVNGEMIEVPFKERGATERETPTMTEFLKVLSNDKMVGIRACNVLANDSIDTLDKLCALSEWDILHMPNSGRKTLEHIKSTMASYGLKLGGNRIGWNTYAA